MGPNCVLEGRGDLAELALGRDLGVAGRPADWRGRGAGRGRCAGRGRSRRRAEARGWPRRMALRTASALGAGGERVALGLPRAPAALPEGAALGPAGLRRPAPAQVDELLVLDLEEAGPVADRRVRLEAVGSRRPPRPGRASQPDPRTGSPSASRRCSRSRTAGRASVNGVRRMKNRPGIVISSEKSVEPAALADDVKHARAPRARPDRVAPGRRTRHRAGRTAPPCGPSPGGRRRAGSSA